jgi:predicted dehydrogenase
MADEPLGCAIVGCGLIARFHARALAEVPGTKLVALVSRKLDNARKMATEIGTTCDVYTDLAQVLARKDIHIVIVSTPSGAHMEPAVAAADAGKRRFVRIA